MCQVLLSLRIPLAEPCYPANRTDLSNGSIPVWKARDCYRLVALISSPEMGHIKLPFTVYRFLTSVHTEVGITSALAGDILSWTKFLSLLGAARVIRCLRVYQKAGIRP